MSRWLRVVASLTGIALWFGLMWLAAYVERRNYLAICPDGWPAGGSRCFRDMFPESMLAILGVIVMSPLVVFAALWIFAAIRALGKFWWARLLLAAIGLAFSMWAVWVSTGWMTTGYFLVLATWCLVGLAVVWDDRAMLRSSPRPVAATAP